MAQRRDFVPLTTLSPHHWNGIEPGASARLAATLDGGRRYPLVRGAQRRRCWSDYHLWRYQHASSPSTRLGALLLGAILSPTSPALRHVVRTMIKP
jgi:hypothetical protein